MEKALSTARAMIEDDRLVTLEQIEEVVDQVLTWKPYRELDRDLLIRTLEAHYSIHIDSFKVIEARERRKPWLPARKADIKWEFWNHYRDYLTEKKGYAQPIVNELDRLTDSILNNLFNPEIEARIDKRGLVVGQVQSGKTGNYAGLICKAADAGFKFIVVLTGIHNSLRSQTQLRLDESFLGFDTQFLRSVGQNSPRLGVGLNPKHPVAHSLTSSLETGDFSAGAANSLGLNFNTNEPIIAVVKKNASVLSRLDQWLDANATMDANGKRLIRGKSLLLVDDEADNASINTSRDESEATRINGLIRSILRKFDRSAYVGYTATPFANIFISIDEDELFPRDFVVSLPIPSNYIGPERVFGFTPDPDDEQDSNTLPIVRAIPDADSWMLDRAKKDSVKPTEIPETLEDAIRAFVLVCAIRRLRGQVNVHNSMLVHISRFIAWQSHIKGLVDDAFLYYFRGIQQNDELILSFFKNDFERGSPGQPSFRSTSEDIMNSSLRDIDAQIAVHEWEDVLPHLLPAAARIVVKEISGGSGDILNYYDHKQGLSVIAIGGDKLSRGLTLEGLSVSYYLRPSRMYDTLMQMGRWFGYRPGYVDLCRLYTTNDLREWFCHVTLAIDELRKEFDYMSDVATSTPEQFALRVRTCPGMLQISAANKIRSATEIRISWSGRLVESYQLCKDIVTIEKNLAAANRLIRSLAQPEEAKSRHYLWRGVSADKVIGFLNEFKVHPDLVSASAQNVARFIEGKVAFGELRRWSVALMSKAAGGKSYEIIKEIQPKLIQRSAQKPEDEDNYFINKSHIISPDDEFIDLTEAEMEEAMKHADGGKRPKGAFVRERIRSKSQTPLLMLYYLDPEKAGIENETPIVGFAISFPGSNRDDTVSFAVHKALIDRLYENDSDDYHEDED